MAKMKMHVLPNKGIILGKKELSLEGFKPVQNRFFIKPEGGLWASSYTPENEFVSSWHEWCHSEMPDWIKEDAVIFNINPDSTCWVIDDEQDLKDFIDIVGEEASPHPDMPISLMWKNPDFENASKNFDYIWLTEAGQWRTRFSHPYSLYGWDCESILILNYENTIESWEYKKLKLTEDKKNVLQIKAR